MIHGTSPMAPLSDEAEAQLNGCGVVFSDLAFKGDGAWYTYDSIDAFYLRQIKAPMRADPLAWLIMLALLFLFYDLAVANIEGVGFVIVVLGIAGGLSFLWKPPDGVEITQTTLMLVLDGSHMEVLRTPDVPFDAFQVIERELSRHVLTCARTQDEGLS